MLTALGGYEKEKGPSWTEDWNGKGPPCSRGAEHVCPSGLGLPCGPARMPSGAWPNPLPGKAAA